jgi:homoserine dehydrogenase
MLDNLQGNNFSAFTGIVNGTTNYILTKMSETGATYQDCLKEAQALGYAEANPTSDVEGFDSTYKLSILSSLAFHTKIPYTKIHREGITTLSINDINIGKKLGFTIKLLAIGRKSDAGIEVRVHPTFIKNSHPLASVSDSFNAVYLTGDSTDDVMLYGRGAGALPTGSAIVGDVLYCATHTNYRYSPFDNTQDASPSTKFIDNFESEYFIRINVVDKNGVLSKVSSVLSRHNVGVAQLVQEKGEKDCVPIVIITHTAKENNVKKALADLASVPEIAKDYSVIRLISK